MEIFEQTDLDAPADLRTPSTISAEVYNMPIEALNLSMRTYNSLRRHGLTLVGEVLDMREDELLNIKNFGRKSLDELQEKLTESELRRPRAEGEEGEFGDYDDDDDDEDFEGDDGDEAEEAEASSAREEREP